MVALVLIVAPRSPEAGRSCRKLFLGSTIVSPLGPFSDWSIDYGHFPQATLEQSSLRVGGVEGKMHTRKAHANIFFVEVCFKVCEHGTSPLSKLSEI